MAKFNTSLVVGLTCVATLGGLLFGWDTAVISGAVTSIDAYFIDPLGLSETARSSLSGWTISSALLGCILGAMAAGLPRRWGARVGWSLRDSCSWRDPSAPPGRSLVSAPSGRWVPRRCGRSS